MFNDSFSAWSGGLGLRQGEDDTYDIFDPQFIHNKMGHKHIWHVGPWQTSGLSEENMVAFRNGCSWKLDVYSNGFYHPGSMMMDMGVWIILVISDSKFEISATESVTNIRKNLNLDA
ncbi:hypothetical protein BVC80_9083g68 [Macleaya cordata]|uniref:Uncharacterized protein n=1 Tax=Macleaya cordata TaxID=56857 RepID=A0A200PRE2_MACCD|nr:hypothetical protein BVC80_9083g68 [Macleaya cordata]